MENEIFSEQNVPKAYLRLSLPLVLSMVVTLIYNLADTFFVARTGDTDLVAGVSLGMPVFTMMMAVGNIFGQGGSSLLSRLFGQKDLPGIRRASAWCFYTTILVGILSAVVLVAFQAPMLRLLGADAQTLPHAAAYYRFLVLGAPIVMLSFIHSNFLRAEGMSRESMAGSILGAVINILLDPVFISVLGWGARGAAIATVIGYLGADLFFVAVVLRKSQILSVDPRDIRVPASHAGQMIAIGIPAAIVNLMQSVSVVFVNQFLLPYGNDKIAAMGIALKVSMIALLLLTGFTFGAQPLFGYYYGAGDKKRLSALLGFCAKFISLTALALTAVICLFAPALMRSFMDTPTVVTDGALMLRWQVVTMVFVGLSMLMTIICQSMGKVAGSFVLSISRQGVLFLLVLLVARLVAGYRGILAAQAVSDLLTAVLAWGIYRWQLRRVFR